MDRGQTLNLSMSSDSDMTRQVDSICFFVPQFLSSSSFSFLIFFFFVLSLFLFFFSPPSFSFPFCLTMKHIFLDIAQIACGRRHKRTLFQSPRHQSFYTFMTLKSECVARNGNTYLRLVFRRHFISGNNIVAHCVLHIKFMCKRKQKRRCDDYGKRNRTSYEIRMYNEERNRPQTPNAELKNKINFRLHSFFPVFHMHFVRFAYPLLVEHQSDFSFVFDILAAHK